jgi:glucose-1-phosphate cytidylyltransferase
MKVVILCGGKGTRIREETEFRPKPMVPIGNRPILWHIMKIYSAFGHAHFVLCLGYKGEMIKEYFRNYLWNTCDVSISLGKSPNVEFHNAHDESNWRITLVETGFESMTAFRVLAIKEYIGEDETFLLTYGDGVGDIDLEKLVEFHNKSGKVCTITGVHPPGRFGELSISEDDMLVKGFNEKPKFGSGYINGGYMVCNRRIFDYLKPDQSIMFEQEPINKLVADGELAVYQHEGYWQCMDTFSEMKSLNKFWENGSAPWKIW